MQTDKENNPPNLRNNLRQEKNLLPSFPRRETKVQADNIPSRREKELVASCPPVLLSEKNNNPPVRKVKSICEERSSLFCSNLFRAQIFGDLADLTELFYGWDLCRKAPGACADG